MEHFFGISNSGYLMYLGKFDSDDGYEECKRRFEGQVDTIIHEEIAKDYQAVLNSILKETAKA